MSLVKYFKPKDSLPNPKGPLSESLPSCVIPAVNSEVVKPIAITSGKKSLQRAYLGFIAG